MAEWTKDPKETGAYWHSLDIAKPSIVWVANGLVYDIFKKNTPWKPTCIDSFYGPLDQPPPMPSEAKPVIATPEPEKQVNPTAHEAAVAWAQSQARQFTYTTGVPFGKAVAEVYKACLAEIEAKTEAPKVAPLSALERQRLKDVNDINAIADNIERMRQYNKDHQGGLGKGL